MSAESDDPSEEDQTLARHRAFAEVLRGERSMAWSDWIMPIYESKTLTPAGQQVALGAVTTLQRVLGNDFLEKAPKREGHPIFSLGIWPANDVPWVYANLFQLAAQLELPGQRRRKVWEALRSSWDSHLWVHSLLQLELAGLGVRAGWDCHFEPIVGSKKGDLLLTNGPAGLLLEMTSMRQSDEGQRAGQFFHRASMYAQHLAWQHAVNISDTLGESLPPEAEALWLQQMEVNARATAQDGKTRQMFSSAGGQLKIAKDASTMGTVNVEGAPTQEDIWPRHMGGGQGIQATYW